MNWKTCTTGAAGLLLATVILTNVFAANPPQARTVEYVTIRWDGRDNTHIVRPGGQVEFIGEQLRAVTRPSKVDERAFYMNLAMNGLTKEGFEIAAMTSDEIVMKRSLK